MAEKDILFYVNRFNVAFHYAEQNFTQGQLVLSQLVNGLQRKRYGDASHGCVSLKDALPQTAHWHFCESQSALLDAVKIIEEWLENFHSEMPGMRELRQFLETEPFFLDTEADSDFKNRGVPGLLQALHTKA